MTIHPDSGPCDHVPPSHDYRIVSACLDLIGLTCDKFCSLVPEREREREEDNETIYQWLVISFPLYSKLIVSNHNVGSRSIDGHILSTQIHFWTTVKYGRFILTYFLIATLNPQRDHQKKIIKRMHDHQTAELNLHWLTSLKQMTLTQLRASVTIPLLLRSRPRACSSTVVTSG